MKISSELKAHLLTFVMSYLLGNIKGLDVLADMLQLLATEARTQADTQK